jgi:hypothetical protein
MAGLWQGDTPGVVPAYRVDEIAVDVDRVEKLGGQASVVEQRPYGLAADLCLQRSGSITLSSQRHGSLVLSVVTNRRRASRIRASHVCSTAVTAFWKDMWLT